MTFDKWYCLFLFCSDWHSGQWSRGYRLGCLIRRRLQRKYGNRLYFVDNGAYCEMLRRSEMYKQLEASYSAKM